MFMLRNNCLTLIVMVNALLVFGEASFVLKLTLV